jgi:hypothetical protein
MAAAVPPPDRAAMAERWARVDALFHAALDRAPDERDRFLHHACGGDTVLVAEVESLLRSDSPSAQHTFEQWAGLVAAARVEDEAAEADRLSRALIGQPLSHYDIIDRLGAGGMGEVYRAKDRALGRQVAIKILPLALAGDPRREDPERLRHLVHEDVEDPRVPLAEALGRRALEEDGAGAHAAHVHREGEPGGEPRDPGAVALPRAEDSHRDRALLDRRADVVAPGGEGVLLYREERRLREPRDRADEQVRRGARGGDDGGRDVAGDDAGEALDDPLQDPGVALGGAHLAGDLRGGLQRLEAAIDLGEEPGPLAAELDVLERGPHRRQEIGLLPGLHEVAPDLAPVDGGDDVLRVGVGGEEDRAELRVDRVRRLDQVDAVHHRHALIGDEEVHPPGPQGLEGDGAARRGQDLVARIGRERATEDGEHVGLVVHEEDDVRHPE